MIGSIIWLIMMRTCATCLVWTGILFSIVMWGFLFIWTLMHGTVLSIILIGFCFAIQICWAYMVRDRIAMAAAMLEISCEVASTFWGTYVYSFVSIFIAAVFISGWGYSAYATMESSGNQDVQGGIGLFFLLSLFWIINVSRYVTHATGAGVTGVWYFQTHEDDPSSSNVSPTLSSLGRALTTSFGSICYGALVISVIEVMRVLAQQLEESDNAMVRFVGCCLDCLLSCIEDIIDYINSYAFTIVAIYGDDYCTAVGRTMDLFSTNGFDLIINDCLIENVLTMGAFGVGAVAAAAGYIKAAASNDNDNDKYACAAAGFVIGLGFILLVNAVVISVVKSIYTCFAMDPLVLYNTKRSKYDKLMMAWSQRFGAVPCQAYLDVAMANNQYRGPQQGAFQAQPQPGYSSMYSQPSAPDYQRLPA